MVNFKDLMPSASVPGCGQAFIPLAKLRAFKIYFNLTSVYSCISPPSYSFIASNF